jgi:hypothetical protein
MPIKTFRGTLIDEEIETIALHTNDGSVGYRIKRFEAIGNDPGAKTYEVVIKIYTVPQTGTPDAQIDFSDQTLLGCLFYQNGAANNDNYELQIFFDNMVVNQDIYLTCHDSHNSPTTSGVHTNYIIELEQVKLDLNQNTVATLKDIRNIEGQ